VGSIAQIHGYKAELSAYAARCGFEVVANFAEVGTGAKNDRIERKKVIELARKRSLIDLVLVSEHSCRGRKQNSNVTYLVKESIWGCSRPLQGR
jgi:hypothetical protein